MEPGEVTARRQGLALAHIGARGPHYLKSVDERTYRPAAVREDQLQMRKCAQDVSPDEVSDHPSGFSRNAEHGGHRRRAETRGDRLDAVYHDRQSQRFGNMIERIESGIGNRQTVDVAAHENSPKTEAPEFRQLPKSDI